MTSLPILVLNSGSSSIKFSIYDASGPTPRKLLDGAADGIGNENGSFRIRNADGCPLLNASRPIRNRAIAFEMISEALHSESFPVPMAIGHRTVCGSPTVCHNQLLTPQLIAEIERYAELAPLHTPIGVYIMRESLRLFPGVPNFAVLDSWFHRTIPEVVAHMPIEEQYAAQGVRRIGYHGISCESILMQLEPNIPERLIVAHLGNGASISAIRRGECVDTSMGLSPTGGIISGTRTGDLDPGVVLYILRQIVKKEKDAHLAADYLDAAVNRNAGLLGLSGVSNDMRRLRMAIQNGHPRARLAVDAFNWTIVKWIGSFFVELGGLDMLVFTGGIGENCTETRAEICERLGSIGVTLDTVHNNVRETSIISAPESAVTVRVIPPAEDLVIVHHVLQLLRQECPTQSRLKDSVNAVEVS